VAPTGCLRPAARGAVLLEVLISLALMVFGLAVVGLRVTTSLESARKSRLWTTSVVLAETTMAELQGGAIQFTSTDNQLSGFYGIRYPGYCWRVEIEPCDVEDLYMMTLKIGYNPAVIDAQIDNPDLELDFDDPNTKIVRTLHRLVPTPADLDLNRDFGIDIEALQEEAANSAATGEGDAVGNAVGAGLWQMISDFLTQHPEIINGEGGIDLNAIKNLPAEDFQMAMEILEQFVGRGSQLNELQNQLSENLGEDSRGGGRGGQGSGERQPSGNTGGIGVPPNVGGTTGNTGGGLPPIGGRNRMGGRDREDSGSPDTGGRDQGRRFDRGRDRSGSQDRRSDPNAADDRGPRGRRRGGPDADQGPDRGADSNDRNSDRPEDRRSEDRRNPRRNRR